MPNLNPAPAKPHTAGILSGLLSILGVVAPLAGYLPPKYGAVIAAAGIVAQAFTKPVTAGSTDLVPKQ
jgi:hypothetical protein